MSVPLQILAMGKYLPPRQVSAAELEARLNLSHGWIEAKNGVSVRHYVDGESNSDLGAKALQRALDKAGLAYEELDLLINASGSYDYPIPETSALIQDKMGQGNSGMPSFTVDATCLSFVTALDVAGAFIASGRYRTIAIVSSEVASKSLNPAEKESATLLGDGAAAAIVRRAPEGSPSALLSSVMETYGSGAMYTHVKGGGNVCHPRDAGVRDSDFTFHMDGPAVLGSAFRRLRPFVKKLFGPLDFSLQEVDLFVPHQASKVALEKAQRFFRLRDEQFANYLAQHGNCIAASIPMALHDAIEAGRIQRGGRICLLGTAAGLSVGGAVLIY
ncbi:MAG: beta-ketoacyl-ACP synthase III [Candidatus Sericytochromatia bacterium]|nr:beta-ketoacyl-ACP synthase III [Candidatus Sericytochromatia bacterium]